MYENFTLLTDGKEAFPEILKCIEEAKSSVDINMFIWRDDDIGNRIAEALLRAANRGVKVSVSADRYGAVLEKSEEAKRSFFPRKLNFKERVSVFTLERLYPTPNAKNNVPDRYTDTQKRFLNHENIIASYDVFKADHSKYYIIDGEILILGGINIEDKENDYDMHGRAYQDYMVKIAGKDYVDAFLTKLNRGEDTLADCRFSANTKSPLPHRFEMEREYLDLIDKAEETLIITMAYFSPLPKFIKAISKACRRGVKISILIPEKANFQNDLNRKTIRRLMKQNDNKITVFLSPKMVHTKFIASEKSVSFGSTNITQKAFKQLSELNLSLENNDSEFVYTLLESVRENQSLSKKVISYKEIKYNRLIALLEGFIC